MGSLKAPGLDGYSVIFFFYQNQWTTKDSLACFIKEIFTGVQKVEAINGNLITLIPKIAMPNNITQFRPIGLYNVNYKMIIIQPFLANLVREEQSSFVIGCQILDNIVIVQEAVHSMQNQNGRPELWLLKLI